MCRTLTIKGKSCFVFGWRLQDPGNPLYHVLYSYLCIPIGANGETSNICVSFHHLLNFNLFVCYSSRPRSPIARSRASRRRYESPPFEGQRGGGGGKYARGHGSPQSPHHRYPFSPTPHPLLCVVVVVGLHQVCTYFSPIPPPPVCGGRYVHTSPLSHPLLCVVVGMYISSPLSHPLLCVVVGMYILLPYPTPSCVWW